MYATLIRPQALPAPPRIPPPPAPRLIAAGAADPDEEARNASIEALLALLDDGETENGVDYSEGALSPNGCLW